MDKQGLWTQANKPLICLCDEEPYSITLLDDELSNFAETFSVAWCSDVETDEALATRVRGFLLTGNPFAVSRAMKLAPKLPNLKAVVGLSAGYDHLYAFKEFGAQCAYCPGGNSDAAADHAMALLMAAGCSILPMLRVTILTDTPRFLPASHRSPGVHHTTLGIFGMGSIGSAIARRAAGFHMKILYHSRTRKSKTEEADLKATYFATLDEMLPNCDYLVASCSLNDSTRHVLGKKQFKLMKRSAIFINVSRGQVVDQDALVSALESGEISGAALDVTDPEPLPPGHPLLKMDNVIITPHSAVFTSRSMRDTLDIAKRNLEASILYNRVMPNKI